MIFRCCWSLYFCGQSIKLITFQKRQSNSDDHLILHLIINYVVYNAIYLGSKNIDRKVKYYTRKSCTACHIHIYNYKLVILIYCSRNIIVDRSCYDNSKHNYGLNEFITFPADCWPYIPCNVRYNIIIYTILVSTNLVL